MEENKLWETISEIGGADENLVCAQEEFRLPSRSCHHAIAILKKQNEGIHGSHSQRYEGGARPSTDVTNLVGAASVNMSERLIHEHEAGRLELHDVCRMW